MDHFASVCETQLVLWEVEELKGIRLDKQVASVFSSSAFEGGLLFMYSYTVFANTRAPVQSQFARKSGCVGNMQRGMLGP